MRTVAGALLMARLAPTSVQQFPPSSSDALSADEVLKLLPGPGVYVHSPVSTPPLVQITPAAAREVRIQAKREQEPVVAQYPGARASVRVPVAEPVFYVYKNTADVLGPNKEKPTAWLVKLAAAGENRELHLGTARPDGRRGSTISVRIKDEALPMVVEALPGDLHRVTSASPLAPGEYALVSVMIFLETVDRFVLRPSSSPIKLRTPIFDFGVEAQ